MQIAIINRSARIDDPFVAFAAKACDAQVYECAQAWGVTPTPVTFYTRGRESELPARNCRIMALVDDIDAPGALGYHDDELGVVYGRVLVQDEQGTSTTLSHECLEELVDPTCDKWRLMPDGRSTALEVCDAVEGDSYGVAVTIAGEQRTIEVSNYLLPRWFDPAAPGAFDRMQILGSPFSMSAGGYMIVRDRDGNEGNIFAPARVRMAKLASGVVSPSARMTVAGKLVNAETRLARRLRAA